MINIVNAFTCVFEAIMSVMFINGFAEDKKRPFSFYLFMGLALITLMTLSNILLNTQLLNIVIVMTMFMAAGFILTKKLKLSAILAVVLVFVILTAEVVVLFSITYLTEATAEQITNGEKYRILGSILSKLLAFGVLKLISLKGKSNRTFNIKTSYWILFVLIFSISTLAIYLLFVFQYNAAGPTPYDDMAVWCSLGLLYNMFFSLFLYERIIKQSDAEREYEIQRERVLSQEKHLSAMLDAQTELKKFRHDIANHFISIRAFFENNDYTAGVQYMDKLDNMAMFDDNDLKTGNTALDAIINYKKQIAENRGIEFIVDARIPENIFVAPIDICTIFGNALDNCIEACELVADGKKKIKVSIIYENDSITCKIINSAVKKDKKFLATTKKDKTHHGFGIQNIKTALGKYKNVCRFTQDKEEFTLFFIIFKA